MLRFETRQNIETRLKLDQKQALKLLLDLRLVLRSPEAFEAKRGLEGILAAHNLLIERNTRGVLIGGLAEEIWNGLRSKIEAHKDVDVLLLDSDHGIEEGESGIDWWVPVEARFEVFKNEQRMEMESRWWQNMNGVNLAFGIDVYSDYNSRSPGLYVLSPEKVKLMRYFEAISTIDSTTREKIEADESVYMDAFTKKMAPYIKGTINSLVDRSLVGRIYRDSSISVSRLDPDLVRSHNNPDRYISDTRKSWKHKTT